MREPRHLRSWECSSLKSTSSAMTARLLHRPTRAERLSLRGRMIIATMPSCLTHPTSGCRRQPPLEGEVCGDTGEALAVFSRTSTATELGATI